MRPVAAVWTDVEILVVDTVRVWCRLLPQVLGVYLMGWLGAQLALKLAAIAGDSNAWLALAIFSTGFLSQLTAVVVILQLSGRELGIRQLIPDEELEADDRDTSITHLLAVTLLPFLGIYAAFGEVQRAANNLFVEQQLRYGSFDSQESILGVLHDAATRHPLRLLLILVAIYALRRLVDTLHERTGRRVLGIGVALLESFFLLLLIMGGIRVWQEAKLWLDDRVFMAWGASVSRQLARWLSVFHIDLPAVLVTVTQLFTDHVWPVLWEVLSQPIIWLAAAALVYGSHVLSLAELWRKGQPLGARIPLVATFARHSEKVAARRIGPPPTGLVRVLAEIREGLLGDIDDKYLPTFHSLRLVLRAGTPFLGAFVLVYALQTSINQVLNWVVDLIVGGHAVDFWVITGPALGLLPNLVTEPLRLCLLAVAFRRCLELFRRRFDSAQPTAPAEAAA